MAEYDSNYSAASLDEAYLDLTDHLQIRASLDLAKRTFPSDQVVPNQQDTKIVLKYY